MTWEEVCADPTLQDLPYKIELNRHGKIVMSPASNWHGMLQARIIGRLKEEFAAGEVISECSVETSDCTKVADVAWLSEKFVSRYARSTPYVKAPEICVEILSPSNSPSEMIQKRALYFEAGAIEVWECDEDGVMSFYSLGGKLDRSAMAPEFPRRM